MGDADLRADTALHVGDRRGQGKSPEHSAEYLLHPHGCLVLRHPVLLHVQRAELKADLKSTDLCLFASIK